MKDLDIEIKETEVVVFQMGKVASTAIVNAIQSCGIKASQPHFLTMDSFLILIKKFENPDLLPWTAKHTLGQIQQNIVIHNRIQKQKKYRFRESDGSSTLKIISIVREPLGWYLSNIVQHYEEYIDDIEAVSNSWYSRIFLSTDLESKIRYFIGKVTKYFYKNIDCADELTISKMASRLATGNLSGKKKIRSLIQHCMIMMRPLFWFQQHFDPIIGTVFREMPFDNEKGFSIIHHDCYDVLILRFEDLMESGNRIIGEFLNVPDFKMEQKNVTADKDIGLVVKNAIGKELFPDTFLNKIFKNDYCSKFYGDRMIEELKEKYRNL